MDLTLQLRYVLCSCETHGMIFLIQQRCFNKSEQQQPNYLNFLHSADCYLEVKRPDAESYLFAVETLEA
jgi:hypothetical protein